MGKFEGYLIGSDYDGTFNRGGISDRNWEALRYFRAEGGRFGIVTGRVYPGVFNSDGKGMLGDDGDFYVCVNGGQCALADGHVFFEAHGTNALAKELYSYIMQVGKPAFVGYASGKTSATLGQRGEEERICVYDLDDDGIYHQINVAYHTMEEAIALRDTVIEKLPGKLNPLLNGATVDIPMYGVSKATGILNCAEYFGVKKENIFTVGDNYNDLDMIREFHGYAVSNAVAAVKEAAEYTVADVAEMIYHIEKTRAL